MMVDRQIVVEWITKIKKQWKYGIYMRYAINHRGKAGHMVLDEINGFQPYNLNPQLVPHADIATKYNTLDVIVPICN